MRRLFALLLLFSLPVLPAQADDENDKMVPPTKIEDRDNRPAPINLSEIEFTTLTPADEFARATTPLVVAMGIGAVTLLVVTLAGSRAKPSKSGEGDER